MADKLIKLCECGCGQPAPIAKQTDRRRGAILGKPRRFVAGHQHKRERNPNWHGGYSIKRNGYKTVNLEDRKEHVGLHIIIAETVLGERLPVGAVVHHIDGNGLNNANNNLVVCQNAKYHRLLHKRKNALIACGNSNWLKCNICKQYDDPQNMYIAPNDQFAHHRHCQRDYEIKRRRLIKGRKIDES